MSLFQFCLFNGMLHQFIQNTVRLLLKWTAVQKLEVIFHACHALPPTSIHRSLGHLRWPGKLHVNQPTRLPSPWESHPAPPALVQRLSFFLGKPGGLLNVGKKKIEYFPWLESFYSYQSSIHVFMLKFRKNPTKNLMSSTFPNLKWLQKSTYSFHITSQHWNLGRRVKVQPGDFSSTTYIPFLGWHNHGITIIHPDSIGELKIINRDKSLGWISQRFATPLINALWEQCRTSGAFLSLCIRAFL